ncbi:chemosensory receptor a [Plakobranchus ocellatus]|uniref:Chemosensory receptor a n=1 Tax=Plakobranchus ocellatus TaxID=259542 RepID=A0AAV3Z2T3_9GAST|nr:chemosensory receptor a [Plakobranchus ocellatus]
MHHSSEEEITRSPAERPMTEGPFQTWANQSSKDPSVQILTAGFMTDEQFNMITLILVFVLQVSNITALIGNSLNIAVFVRLGFAEPSNISLTALAICDLVCVISSIWSNLCFLLNFWHPILPFNVTNVSILTGGGLWSFVSRTVAWITAFISFERCLCILVPLKVKSLITPRTTLTAMLIIAALTVCPFLFSFLNYNFVWVYYLQSNATILDVVPNDNKYSILIAKIVFVICGVIQPVLAFFIVTVCTVFLVVQLKKVSLWRTSVTSAKSQWEDNSGENTASNNASATQNRISQKEERLVRLVVVIAVIFIACFIPTCALLLCSALFDEFFVFGVYGRIFVVCSLITFLGQSVSGSVNTIVYYNMASKFRSGLRELLGLNPEEEKIINS